MSDEDSSSESIYPIVDVTPTTTGVTLENLVIDGSSVPSPSGFCGSEFVVTLPVELTERSAVDTGLNVTDLDQGCGGDQAILVQSGTGGIASVTVTGSTIASYGKNGVKCMDTGSTCTITDNTITTSSTGEVAQNGIEVSFGATGTVSGNTVSGDSYTGSTNTDDPQADYAAGVLLYGASTGTVVSGNTLDDDQIAVESVASDASITGNTISGQVATSRTASRLRRAVRRLLR